MKELDDHWHGQKGTANYKVAVAAIAAERERCAKIAENWLEVFGATNPQHIDAQTWACDAVRDIAELIRHPETKQ